MYYSGNKKFSSKLDAIIHFNKTKENTFFYYYDEVYDKLNWRMEPPGTLDFYYREQAQRIRDNYDYVILCFSGGADSTNILETFHYNKIKLDKVITVGAFSQDSHSMVEENHNGEIYFVAHPYLRELGLESITQHIDYTKYFDNFGQFSVNQYGNEWSDVLASWYSPHNFFWRDLHKFVVPKNMENKRVAIIFGQDKATLEVHKSGALGFKFADCNMQAYGTIQSKDNCDIIQFYHDPQFPLIAIKQTHILKKAYDIKKTIAKDKNRGVQIISGISVNELIYNLKKPITYVTPKSRTVFLSIRDEYIENKKDSDVYNFYLSGIKHLSDKIGGLDKYMVFFSKFYRIE